MKDNHNNLFLMLTSSEKYRRPIPTGMNAIPMTKKVGRTVPAVSMGCQAGSRCCLNADSTNIISESINRCKMARP